MRCEAHAVKGGRRGVRGEGGRGEVVNIREPHQIFQTVKTDNSIRQAAGAEINIRCYKVEL